MKKNGSEIAKRIMVRNVVTASTDETVEELLKRLYRKKPLYENFDYVYITNLQKHLLGIVSTKDIINVDKKTVLGNIMNTHFVSAKPFTDQERVAKIAIKYSIKAVPVIDGKGILLGVIPPREIFRILQWESTEDILRSSGVAGKSQQLKKAIEKGPMRMSILRLPSLLIGVLGGIAATSVMEFFHASLESQLVLAFFVPVLLYLSAAVGTQTGTIFVRNIATENVHYPSYVLKEFITGGAIAAVLGGLMFLIVYLWHNSVLVALTIGLSLLIAIMIATFLGVMIPLALMAFKKDPAISGGPIINVVQDIITLLTYFIVASFVLL
jgi:magnesium transporter